MSRTQAHVDEMFEPLRKKQRSTSSEENAHREQHDGGLSGQPPYASMSESRRQETQWRRQELGIHVDGRDVAPLMETLDAMPLPQHVLQVLRARGITTPTPIQSQAVPCALSGRDVIGLAATGSGKTLAYILPWLARTPLTQDRNFRTRITNSKVVAAPEALIIVPTRELMDQVFHELRSFCGASAAVSQSSYSHSQSQLQFVSQGEFFSAGAVCGGVPLHEQLQQLRACASGIDILVATPGRLIHFAEQRLISLDSLTYIVLDEVDRMLDAEMEPQLRQILQLANEVGRQTLLWSATMPQFLDRLARSATLDAVTIRVGMGVQHTGRTALGVTQDVRFVRFADKKHQLLQVLRHIPAPPVLVFCNSHECVEFVARFLRHEQFHVAALHGDKPQSHRFQVMAALREGYVDVLVATDLASRGLDFEDVDHVVLFDMPHSIEDYVHRCGRTGRRHRVEADGSTGTSRGHVTAFLTIECDIAADLKQLLKETKQKVPLELEMPSRFRPSRDREQ